MFIILGIFALTEDEAKDIVLERNESLYDMMTTVAVAPIDIKTLKAEAKKNSVQIQINTPEKNWKTSRTLPHQDELLPNAVKLGKLYFTQHNSQYYLLAEQNNTWVIITSQIANLIVYPKWMVFWPWCVVMLVLFISYWLLTRQLKPIKDAIHSAQQISEGNFNYKITHHPKNDLAELTHGLDNMAEELNKLFTAKDELLLAVSHELRSPMARMKVSFALLEQNEIVRRLDKDVNKMDVIIGQLLESARLQQSNKALHIETFFLPSFIDEALSEYEHSEQCLVVNEIPDVAIDMDGGRIKFVLRNLLDNAITHSGDEEKISIRFNKNGATLDTVIQDKGRGISAKYLPELFEPFASNSPISNRSSNGLGLGLYLCKRIAIAHKGNLSVVSDEGKGCIFTLSLPFYP